MNIKIQGKQERQKNLKARNSPAEGQRTSLALTPLGKAGVTLAVDAATTHSSRLLLLPLKLRALPALRETR
jgi:hypothetical protein